MVLEKKNYIKHIKEYTGFEKNVDFTKNKDKHEYFLFKYFLKEHTLEIFFENLLNTKNILANRYNNKQALLFKIFAKKVFKLKIHNKEKGFISFFNIFFLNYRHNWWSLYKTCKKFNNEENFFIVLNSYQPTFILHYLRKLFYSDNRNKDNIRGIINNVQKNPKFRYNDPYYIAFRLLRLKRLRRKLLIGALRNKAKLNTVKNFFCLEGSIGLKGASYANLVKTNKISLIRVAYDLHNKYKIPLKYKKFKKITFKLTKLNQYRFSIIRRPEYTFWYKKMHNQLTHSEEHALVSLVNEF